MKIVYVAHSMTNGQKDMNVVNKLIEWLKNEKYRVEQPIDISVFHDYLAKKSLNLINKMDIIIADVSNYSHGVGFELGYAFALNKNIIVICHYSSKEKISKFLIGLFPNMIYYENEIDLIDKISLTLNKFSPPTKILF